jgi:hypothetical protein
MYNEKQQNGYMFGAQLTRALTILKTVNDARYNDVFRPADLVLIEKLSKEITQLETKVADRLMGSDVVSDLY